MTVLFILFFSCAHLFLHSPHLKQQKTAVLEKKGSRNRFSGVKEVAARLQEEKEKRRSQRLSQKAAIKPTDSGKGKAVVIRKTHDSDDGEAEEEKESAPIFDGTWVVLWCIPVVSSTLSISVVQ